jgi:uncharacterized protein YggU (UPF0235/DUF167 family)
MIVGSLLLVLLAVGLLVAGTARVSDPMLYGSIAMSGLAAVTLIAGVRRLARDASMRRSRPAVYTAGGVPFSGSPPGSGAGPDSALGAGARSGAGSRSGAGAGSGDDAHPVRADSAGAVELEDGIPLDEPAAEWLDDAEIAELAAVPETVHVINTRPRFHLDGCLHLLGRGYQQLAISEAIEAGFTPCAMCRPADALLRRRNRVGGRHDGPYGPAVVVSVTAPAVDGRATEAALRAVAEALGLRRHEIALRAGGTSRDKLFQVAQPPPDLPARLATLTGR